MSLALPSCSPPTVWRVFNKLCARFRGLANGAGPAAVFCKPNRQKAIRSRTATVSHTGRDLAHSGSKLDRLAREGSSVGRGGAGRSAEIGFPRGPGRRRRGWRHRLSGRIASCVAMDSSSTGDGVRLSSRCDQRALHDRGCARRPSHNTSLNAPRATSAADGDGSVRPLYVRPLLITYVRRSRRDRSHQRFPEPSWMRCTRSAFKSLCWVTLPEGQMMVTWSTWSAWPRPNVSGSSTDDR